MNTEVNIDIQASREYPPKVLSDLGYIVDTPFVILKDSVVLADMHLGFLIKNYKFPAKTKRKLVEYEVRYILAKITSVINRYSQLLRSKNIYILGDVKEPLGYPDSLVRRGIVSFFTNLQKKVNKVVVIRGNHDGKLTEVFDEYGIDIEIADNITINIENKSYEGTKHILLVHGHMKIPKTELMSASSIIMGHIHPAIGGNRKPVTVSIEARLIQLNSNEMDHKVINIEILPTINPVLGGIDINEKSYSVINLAIRRILPPNIEYLFRAISIY